MKKEKKRITIFGKKKFNRNDDIRLRRLINLSAIGSSERDTSIRVLLAFKTTVSNYRELARTIATMAHRVGQEIASQPRGRESGEDGTSVYRSDGTRIDRRDGSRTRLWLAYKLCVVVLACPERFSLSLSVHYASTTRARSWLKRHARFRSSWANFPFHAMERENVATVSRLEQAFVSRHSIRSSI